MFNEQRSIIQQLISWLFVDLLPVSQQEMLFLRLLQRTDARTMESFANEHVFVCVCWKTQQAVSGLMHPLADFPSQVTACVLCILFGGGGRTCTYGASSFLLEAAVLYRVSCRLAICCMCLRLI